MNYPCLVPKRLCRTKIQVYLASEEITNLGKPRYTADLELTCNFQDKAKTLVQITGTALFPGDIAPDMPSLSGGTVTVFGEERRIVQGTKNRNPDGTVNYCTLEVM